MGIGFDGKNMVITGNKCGNSFLTYQKYGLYIRNLSGVTENALINNNDFSNNITAAVGGPASTNTFHFFGFNNPHWMEGTFGTGGFSVTAGATTTLNFNITGAQFGDMVVFSAPYDLQGINATAYVQSSGVVYVVLHNQTGSTKTFGVGTWRAKIIRG